MIIENFEWCKMKILSKLSFKTSFLIFRSKLGTAKYKCFGSQNCWHTLKWSKRTNLRIQTWMISVPFEFNIDIFFKHMNDHHDTSNLSDTLLHNSLLWRSWGVNFSTWNYPFNTSPCWCVIVPFVINLLTTKVWTRKLQLCLVIGKC